MNVKVVTTLIILAGLLLWAWFFKLMIDTPNEPVAMQHDCSVHLNKVPKECQ